MSLRRTFAAYFAFNGWKNIQLGVHVSLAMPNFELHVPFGFFRVGFETRTFGDKWQLSPSIERHPVDRSAWTFGWNAPGSWHITPEVRKLMGLDGTEVIE